MDDLRFPPHWTFAVKPVAVGIDAINCQLFVFCGSSRSSICSLHSFLALSRLLQDKMTLTDQLPAKLNLRAAILRAEGTKTALVDLQKLKPLQVMRTLNVGALKSLVSSIEARGFLDRYPLFVVADSSDTFMVLRGNHRLEAAKKVGGINRLPVQKLKLNLAKDVYPSRNLLLEISSIATSVELHAFPRSKMSKVYELVGLLRAANLVDKSIPSVREYFRQELFRDADHWLFKASERTFYRFCRWARLVMDSDCLEIIGELDSLACDMDKQIDTKTFESWAEISQGDAVRLLKLWIQKLKEKPDALLRIPPNYAATPIRATHSASSPGAEESPQVAASGRATEQTSAGHPRQERSTAAGGTAPAHPDPFSPSQYPSTRTPYIDDMAAVDRDVDEDEGEESVQVETATRRSQDVQDESAAKLWVAKMKKIIAAVEKDVEDNPYRSIYGQVALKEVIEHLKSFHSNLEGRLNNMVSIVDEAQRSPSRPAKRFRTS